VTDLSPYVRWTDHFGSQAIEDCRGWFNFFVILTGHKRLIVCVSGVWHDH
jgi:hypothetical protein